MSTRSRRGRPIIDMTGATCGQLTVLSRHGNVYGNLAAWRVQCTCGTVFVAAGSHLRTGKTWRCKGCASRALSEIRKGHGETAGYLHRAWSHIRQSHREGAEPTATGRGAPVCAEWSKSYTRFAADIRRTIGERPSILYCLVLLPGSDEWRPGAVRWAARGDWMTGFKRPSVRRVLPKVRPPRCDCR